MVLLQLKAFSSTFARFAINPTKNQGTKGVGKNRITVCGGDTNVCFSP